MKATRLALGLAICSIWAGGVQAQTTIPGDPYGGDPVGVVADPCPVHPLPTPAQGWGMWNLHMVARDFGQLCRYRQQNAALEAAHIRPRVVFLGDSITDIWIKADPDLFTNGLVDRGISGQTTPQMLVRFRQDVIDLHPQAALILAGVNDIAGNTGASTMEAVEGNIESMVELAQAHGIKVLLASTTPASVFPWIPGKRPATQIIALDAWLRDYCVTKGLTYVDYYSALVDQVGGMKPGLSSDGVHPTKQGFAIMRPIALAAISTALDGK